MKTVIGVGLALSLLAAPIQARAENGQIAAGIHGGLAAGALIASAKRPPPPVYYAPGAPVWDQWRGIWVRPQVRVCN